MTSEQEAWDRAMTRFLPHGTIDTEIAQMGELADALRGHITGANLIAESTADGHRYQVKGIRWEPTIEHPEGRLILVLSGCTHWSEDCDKKVVAANEHRHDPRGCYDGTYRCSGCGNELTADEAREANNG